MTVAIWGHEEKLLGVGMGNNPGNGNNLFLLPSVQVRN